VTVYFFVDALTPCRCFGSNEPQRSFALIREDFAKAPVMGLKKNEKLGDELQFLSAKIALLRSGGFRDRRLNATNTRKHTHTHTHTHHRHLHRKIFVVKYKIFTKILLSNNVLSTTSNAISLGVYLSRQQRRCLFS